METGVELWYRSHERDLAPSIAWRPEFPRENSSYREVPLGEKAKQFLRYDEGIDGFWREGSTHWQMIFLRWDPGRVAVHLAKGHTPETCLTAAGKNLVSVSEIKQFRVGSLELPFRSYTVEENGQQLHVFYCLWEDRGTEQGFKKTRLTLNNRLGPVLAGRRNLGQRSLEIAVAGFPDAAAAEEAVRAELPKLLRVD